MSKKLIILIIFIGIILTVIVGSWLMWYLKADKTINAYILDKTVPRLERTEHKAFNWILNHNKYVKSNGDLYDINKDYYGFFPINSKSQEFDFKSVRIHEIEDLVYEYDMLYYTDTYGVYYNEWYKKGSSDVKHTQKVYGGLNQNDYLLLKAMKEKNKLIITEFNLYNAPTNGLIREKVESLFGLKWSGWTGKYFPSLDSTETSDFPKWIVDLYKEQNNNEWPYTKSGIVLIHKFGTISVLELDTHLNTEIPVITSSKDAMERFGVPEEIAYSNWFDITNSQEQNDVIASFNLNVNAKGDSILQSYNLNSSFPAVIEHIGDYKFYYFGGDFAESRIASKTAYFEGLHNVLSSLSKENYSNSNKFFWKYYVPMVTSILDDYNKTLVQYKD